MQAGECDQVFVFLRYGHQIVLPDFKEAVYCF